METTQSQQREVLLNETIAHYTSSNRSINGDVCNYKPSKTSEGCAIGRKIADKELCTILDSTSLSLKDGTSVFYVFYLLPEDLKILGKEFLSELQDLHDSPNHWNKTGLTYEGQRKVELIRENFII